MAKLTRKERVLAELRSWQGAWVPGHWLTDPSVGGSEGLRRLRELRADGHVIEMRRAGAGRSTRQYRLVEELVLWQK